MNHLAALDELGVPEAEERFFDALRDRGDPALAHWARSYHFFSLSQARLLALVVGALPATDYQSLAEVAKALHEEYGSGDADAVHSRLFARFCEALGLPPEDLPVPHQQVEPGVLQYLQAIEAGYRSGDPGVMLATYCFLERSAVLSYPLMLRRLQALGFSAADLVFFSTHVVQEAQHDQGAQQLAQRLVRTPGEAQGFVRQLQTMQQAWAGFWQAFAARPARAG
jgi:pyrroloquinoline quinone (PQQ) biosynthesis protein C